MIIKPGTVTITPSEIRIEGFHFEGVDMNSGAFDALRWAQRRIEEEKRKA